MKYNKSEIMKMAWSAYKADRRLMCKTREPRSFGECLAYAWSEAKAKVEHADSIKAIETMVRNNNLVYGGRRYQLKLWTKGSNARVYVKCDWKDMGYVDVMTGENCCRRLDDDIAAAIRNVYGKQLSDELADLAQVAC